MRSEVRGGVGPNLARAVLGSRAERCYDHLVALYMVGSPCGARDLGKTWNLILPHNLTSPTAVCDLFFLSMEGGRKVFGVIVSPTRHSKTTRAILNHLLI